MKTQQSDLTIDDVMRDPLIRQVMRADRVEPRQLEILLRQQAAARREVLSLALFDEGAAPRRSVLCASACW